MQDCQPPAPCFKFPTAMKQYRPNVEHQRWLYSMMKSRAVMRRRQGKPEGNADVALGKKQIPDNSEPWLPGGVRSVADAL